MYAYVSRRRYKDHVRAYLQICVSERVNGTPVRRVLASLGRIDDLTPATIDSLITSLRRFGTPGASVDLSQLEAVAARCHGPVRVARQLWDEIGIPGLIASDGQSFDVDEALFRLVANRLVDPRSKLATTEWQETVTWPGGAPSLSYAQFLRAMDVVQAQKETIEDGVFSRVRELFSVPLRIVWYDLTSSYFDGDGVCDLAAFGYSRDHRSDRRQVVIGLALSQEGFPIAHDVFAGNTADVHTVGAMARGLRERFGFGDAIVVGDRGLLSAENAAELDGLGMRYVLGLRTRQHAQVPAVVAAAVAAGMTRPRGVEAPWSIQEVAPIEGVRHVVVYSAFRAVHDRAVRARRLWRTRAALGRVRSRVATGRLRGMRAITEQVTRVLAPSKVSRLIAWEVRDGRLWFGFDHAACRAERDLDGIFVLVSNAPELTTTEIADAYHQLIAVEDAFRVLKTLVKLRPMYHWTERRVRAHIFICVLAYLLTAILEHRLARAGTPMSAARALDALGSVQAVEQIIGEVTLTQLTRPNAVARQILDALGLADIPRVLSMARQPTPS